jgi:hypothetical protein
MGGGGMGRDAGETGTMQLASAALERVASGRQLLLCGLRGEIIDPASVSRSRADQRLTTNN